MHEQSLMSDLMHQLAEIVRRERAQRVVTVRVCLGALSHFSPAHFSEHFTLASKGGPAEGARLEIRVGTDRTERGADGVAIESVDLLWESGA